MKRRTLYWLAGLGLLGTVGVLAASDAWGAIPTELDARKLQVALTRAWREGVRKQDQLERVAVGVVATGDEWEAYKAQETTWSAPLRAKVETVRAVIRRAFPEATL